MPSRIQRRRTPGWRMPAGCIYVGRPTKWGNPWGVMEFRGAWWVGKSRISDTFGLPRELTGPWPSEREALREAIETYRHQLAGGMRFLAKQELRGHDLACWCPIDQPCHADVLLELANA